MTCAGDIVFISDDAPHAGKAFDHFERPVPLVRVERWRMLEKHLQPGTPLRSVGILDGVEWYDEVASKLQAVVGDIEDRSFSLKKSQPGFLETPAHLIDGRRTSFFAHPTAGP